MLSADHPITQFVARAILGGCVDAIMRERVSETQRLDALKFLARFDVGPWGLHARHALKNHMEQAVERLRDVITPKPDIIMRDPMPRGRKVTRSNDPAKSTDVMRGFGAGFFTWRRGQA
jgi:hypothetical protein